MKLLSTIFERAKCATQKASTGINERFAVVDSGKAINIKNACFQETS